MRKLTLRKNLRRRTIPAVLAAAMGALAIFSTPLATVSAAAAELQFIDVSDLAEKLLPAVVNIRSTRTVEGPKTMPEAPEGSPFRFFFGPDQPQQARSIGSGPSAFLCGPLLPGLAYVQNQLQI